MRAPHPSDDRLPPLALDNRKALIGRRRFEYNASAVRFCARWNPYGRRGRCLTALGRRGLYRAVGFPRVVGCASDFSTTYLHNPGNIWAVYRGRAKSSGACLG